MNQLKKKELFGLLVLALLAAAGYAVWQKYQSTAKVDADAEKPVVHTPNDTIRFAENAPQLAYLQVKAVDEYPEPLVEPLNARLAYDDNQTARVFSPISGRVLKITADAGREIRAGQALLELDAPDYAQATADDVKAKADLQHKRQAFERARELVKVNGISLREMEGTEADFHQAEAEAQRADARLHNLQSAALVTDGKFVLRAPISGTISERQVNVGSEVRTDAASPLFVVTNARRLWALIDLPERYLDKVRVGQPVSIEVDAYPGEAFQGKITVVAETLDPLTRRIQVRAEIDNSSLRLKPEMFARATPVADSHNSMPRVPNAALFTIGLRSFVFVEQSPGVLQRRHVELGLQSHEYSYVKEGLLAGDRVVTSGALLLNSELAGND
ncbi:MAG: efflux RND transporter periplasmic adaptor subunit [Sideroxydans sp.]|nr:efflux RND transporter periplasmic adaptor subunit [Sideroxyarcus sp.]